MASFLIAMAVAVSLVQAAGVTNSPPVAGDVTIPASGSLYPERVTIPTSATGVFLTNQPMPRPASWMVSTVTVSGSFGTSWASRSKVETRQVQAVGVVGAKERDLRFASGWVGLSLQVSAVAHRPGEPLAEPGAVGVA